MDSIHQLIQQEPHHAAHYLYRARMYKDARNDEMAIRDYEKVMALDSQNFSACFELGDIYMTREENEKALLYNQKALALDTAYFLAKHRIKILKESLGK